MSDLNVIPDDGEEQADTIRKLDATQQEVTGPDYAAKAGLLKPTAAPQTSPDSWGALVKDHPVLSQKLTDPDFAYHAKDDVHNLSALERVFRGWDEMAWKSKLDLEADARNQRLAAIGRAQRAGTATPEMLKEADGLDDQARDAKGPDLAFVPGIIPSVVGGAPGMLRAAPTAAWYGALGAIGGTLLTKNPKFGVAAGGAMASAGFTVGMAADTAKTEQGLAYRQYVQAGADPQTAGVAADIVALANGGLQAIPAEKILNIVPGLSRLLAGRQTRDLVSRLISSNTGRAALGRVAARAGESGLLMALVSGGQELVRELGAVGAGAKEPDGSDATIHGDRIGEAMESGGQQGLGFGLAHGGYALPADLHEVQLGKARGEMFKSIGGISTDSKLRESMPDAYKQFVNSIVADQGNVKEATAPAEKLNALLQSEGISQERLERDMPSVAKQLATAKPTDEITIPMGDLATHLAPLKGFPGLTEDLRVGDSLTAREAKEAQTQAAKMAEEKPTPTGDEEPTPARRVYDDVYGKLTGAGQAPEVAQKDAALWAAFATARGERTGVDPFDYYSKRAVSIGAEFPNAAQNLMQKHGEIRRILAALPKNASLMDLRRALEGEAPKITDKELEEVRQLRAQVDKIADFGEDLKRKLVSGADVSDDQLSTFLATEKSRKEGRMPTPQEIDEAVARAQEFTLHQAAYHGTPYNFDKFTLDHIGEGEGNQSYGWGLYFAEKKAIADYYKKALTAGRDRDLLVDGKPANTMTAKSYGELDAISTLREFLYDDSVLRGKAEIAELQKFVDEQIKERKRSIKEAEESNASDANRPLHESIFKDVREQRERSIQHDKDFLAAMEELRNKKLSVQKIGAVHEVEVPEKEDLLDYDRPLTFEPKVLEKLKTAGIIPEKSVPRSLGGSEGPNEFMTGKELYEYLKGRSSDKGASMQLLQAGVPGLKYLDNTSRSEGVGTHNFVVWDENAIKTLRTLEQGANEGYRGKISFDDARSFFNITLTGKANLSTFIHESGHAFLEFLRMDAEGGHEQSKADFDKIKEWLGVKDGEKPSVEQLETFARGFEAYAMEGKAPAPGLREAFRAFAGWMKHVYHSIKSLGVNLTDDVRGVMDRMLATDTEIEKARQGLGLEPMEKPEGMSDKEFADYRAKFGRAIEDTRERLEREALKEFRRTIGEDREKVKKEVTEETAHDPARNAYEALRSGKRLDGVEVPEEIKGQKLSREAVREFPGYSESKKWGAITAPDGLDPEVAAPYFGYKSGEELLTAIETLRDRAGEIKDETERRMMGKYPNAAIAKMQDAAVKAFHETSSVRDVMWTEARETAKYLKGLEKQTLGEERPDPSSKNFRVLREALKEYARTRVNDMTGLEMQPGKFSRAEARHAEEWADNMKKGDFEKAYQAKLDQIEAHEMSRAVSEAKDEIDGIRDYLSKFDDLGTRRKLGKAGQNYLGAIDSILQDIELKRQTNKALERRASLESYLTAMEGEDGALITIPPELRSEVDLKNYRQMTLEELRTVRDAVKNIEAMARLKNKLFDGREQRNYQETVIKASEQVKSNLGNAYGEKPGAPQNPGFIARKMMSLRKSVAEMKKIEFLVRAMDGGQTAGFLHEILFQPLATAEAKALDLKRAITDKLLEPLKKMSMKERFELDKTVDFVGTPMKMRDVIAVALNMGNDGNKKKLIDGYAYRGWTEEKVTQRLGELLTDKHLDLVVHFWKTIGSMWPEIKALSERSTGLAPPQVEPTKLTIRGRELEGGYYPIVYDRDRSYKAEQIAQRKGDLFENNFLKPNTSKGFTEARTAFSAPMLLSLNIIPAHIQEVIHYLTHFEPVRAIDRIMAHPEMRKAVTEGLGRETYNLFRPWLQAIASDGAVHDNTTTIDNVLRHLRVGASVTRLGFRVTNSLMQGFNLLSTVKELGGAIDGPKYLALGLKTYMREVESFRDPFGPLMDKETGSAEMRGKASKMEQTLIGGFDEYASAFGAFGSYKNKLAHFSLSFMALAWKSVEAMTWYGAREKAFAEDHPRPQEYADSVVRLAQMGEGVKDKAAIMRGGEGTKIFTYMYSWYSTIFNQLTETQPRDRGNWKKAGELGSRYFWMVLAPTVMMSLARGKHGKNDDGSPGSEAGYLGGELALETAKSYLGPIGGVAADTMLSGHDAKFAPWISTVLRGMVVRGKMVAGGQLTEHEKKDLFESTGIVSHLPAGAIYNAMKYIQALQDGKIEEPIKDLLLRSPGDWK